MYFWMPRGDEVILMTKIHGLKLILMFTFVVLIIGGCAAPAAPTPTPTPTPEPTPASVPTLSEVQEIKNVIQTNVQDTTVQYLRESFWSKND